MAAGQIARSWRALVPRPRWCGRRSACARTRPDRPGSSASACHAPSWCRPQASLSDLNVAPASATWASRFNRSRVARTSLSSRVTITVSPGWSRCISLPNSLRSDRALEAFSWNTLVQPAAFSSASWAARLWSRVGPSNSRKRSQDALGPA